MYSRMGTSSVSFRPSPAGETRSRRHGSREPRSDVARSALNPQPFEVFFSFLASLFSFSDLTGCFFVSFLMSWLLAMAPLLLGRWHMLPQTYSLCKREFRIGETRAAVSVGRRTVIDLIVDWVNPVSSFLAVLGASRPPPFPAGPCWGRPDTLFAVSGTSLASVGHVKMGLQGGVT
jgi:hypothetical protein